MKYLIVNADDFGYSYGVNRGIIEAHVRGIVTSTSVMVDAIAATEASSLKDYPELSVGLHFVITTLDAAEAELTRQVEQFVSIVGQEPDHIDSHKIYTDREGLKNVLLQFSNASGIPVRRLGKVKFIDSFFGPHADGDLSINQFQRAIDQATDDYNEIMCHPGYADDYIREHSSYNDQRQEELETLCDPSVKQYLAQKNVALCNWKRLSTT